MSGLLSQFTEFAKTPEGQGLLSAAFGGLATAQRGAPLNSIGRAGMAGLAGYTNAQDRVRQQADNAFQQQYRTMQMDAMRQQQDKAKAEQAWRGKLPELMAPKLQGQTEQARMLADQMGPDASPEDVQAMNQGARMPATGLEYGMDKTALQRHLMDPASPFADELMKKQLFPGEKKYLTVGGAVIDPDTMKPVYTTPEKINPNQPFMMVDGKPVANPAYQAYEMEKASRGASRVTTNVDARNFNTQESEQSKTYGKALGEMRGEVTRAGFEAPGKLARLDRMEKLLQGIDGGAAAPAMADIASFAQSFGIKIDPKLGNKQAAEALAREMAGSLRQPGTGPMTDKDFENFLRQVPSLSKTAEGRKQIMGTMRQAIQRDITASKFARDYAKRNNGVIDDNFYDAMSEFYATNPVVLPQMPATNARGNLFQSADEIINRGRK